MKKKKCLDCGAEFSEDVKFCPECGSANFENTILPNFETKVCHSCGKESYIAKNSSSAFCQHCGNDMNKTAIQMPNPTQVTPGESTLSNSKPLNSNSINTTATKTFQYGICPSCNSALHVPINTETCVCGNCGRTINTKEATASVSSFLNNWKTSIGASIGGALVGYAINSLINLMANEESTALLGLFLWIVYIALCLLYAAYFYNSLFKPNSKNHSSTAVSFCNLLFGGIVFGCIWNSNLTKKKRGISYIVFIVFLASALIYIFI